MICSIFSRWRFVFFFSIWAYFSENCLSLWRTYRYRHIKRKRIFAYSDRVNFDNSLYGNIRIRWEGRSFWVCAYCLNDILSKVGLSILLIYITRESKPYTVDEVEWWPHFPFLCFKSNNKKKSHRKAIDAIVNICLQYGRRRKKMWGMRTNHSKWC